VAGLGQALFEDIGYDVSGNPMSATFASYLLPAASELCSIETETLGTVTERNPLGTRGIGENGCNAATASAHNAVLDALADTGIRHLDLPLTPEKIWQSITGRTSNGPMVSGLATSAHYDETDGSTAADR
jgi:aerobic carbon-monoxide dehydrogenase large subunit